MAAKGRGKKARRTADARADIEDGIVGRDPGKLGKFGGGGKTAGVCEKKNAPVAFFPAHWAPNDMQIYRVELPGPKVSKDVPSDAKVTLSVTRSHFNELATKGHIKEWRAAFEHGDAKVTGIDQIIKLITNVVERQEERSRTRHAKSH